MTKSKLTQRKLPLADAISEAFGEIIALAEEMREAYDNTPESLQQSAVGEARDEAANALEDIQEAELPDWLSEQHQVTIVEIARTQKQMMRRSRPARRDDVVVIMDACIQYLEWMQESVTELSEDQSSDLEQLIEDITNAKDELEAVEFPGMYG